MVYIPMKKILNKKCFLLLVLHKIFSPIYELDFGSLKILIVPWVESSTEENFLGNFQFFEKRSFQND